MNLIYIALGAVIGVTLVILAANALQTLENKRWLRMHQKRMEERRKAMGIVEDRTHLGM